MRTVCLILLNLVISLVRLPAAEAVQTLVDNVFAGLIFDEGGGFGLRTRTNIQITALGYEFPLNGYSTGVVTVVSQTTEVLRSIQVSTNSPKLGKFHYESVTPLVVTAAKTIFLLGNNYEIQSPNFNALWLGNTIPTNEFRVSPDFDYLGAAQGTNLSSVTRDSMFQGVNFQYTGYPTPPPLHLALTLTNTIVLSWPTGDVTFRLQACSRLDAAITNLNLTPDVKNGSSIVVIPTTEAAQYFRLAY